LLALLTLAEWSSASVHLGVAKWIWLVMIACCHLNAPGQVIAWAKALSVLFGGFRQVPAGGVVWYAIAVAIKHGGICCQGECDCGEYDS